MTQGNYIDALNPDKYVTGRSVNNRRWRVRDNLPGSRDFCPMLRRIMTDGNGRISRFLINDILRRDGVVPPPIILPISATITKGPRQQAAYDQARKAIKNCLEAPDNELDGIIRSVRENGHISAKLRSVTPCLKTIRNSASGLSRRWRRLLPIKDS